MESTLANNASISVSYNNVDLDWSEYVKKYITVRCMSLAEPLATTGSNRVVQHPYKNQKAKTAQCTEVEILLPISNLDWFLKKSSTFIS